MLKLSFLPKKSKINFKKKPSIYDDRARIQFVLQMLAWEM